MPSPNIHAGIWTRRVPWANGKYWRTDIRATVISDSWIRFARYILKDGPIIQVPMDDIRAALANAPTRQNDTIIGPYNIDPFAKRLNERPVNMTFGPFTDLDYDEIQELHSRVRPGRPTRPRVETFYTDAARLLLDRVRSGQTTYDRLLERIEELNPSLRVFRERDGSVTLHELAYAVRVNYLRAMKEAHDELLTN